MLYLEKLVGLLVLKLYLSYLERSACRCYCTVLSTEIIGVPKKFGQSLDRPYAHAAFSPKFLTGFYSEWPYKCTHQI